jgi:hypothetical protein
MLIFNAYEYKLEKNHYHALIDFEKLVNFDAFKSPLKYILCSQMAWELLFLVN